MSNFNGVEFYKSVMRGVFDTAAEPTGEDLSFKDSINRTVADGAQIADTVDGEPNGRLQPDTDLIQGDNSTFDSDTGDWTTPTDIDIANGKLEFDDTNNDATITVGANTADYVVVFTISDYVAGDVTPVLGGTAGTARSSAATFTETITHGGGTTFVFNGANSAELNISIVTIRLADKFRYDMALDRRTDADCFIVVNHNARDVFPGDEKESVKLYHDTDANFSGATEIVPSTEFAHKYGAEEQTFLDFDGVDDVVTVADDADLDLGTGDGSYEAWIKFKTVGATQQIASRRTSAANEFVMGVGGGTTFNCSWLVSSAGHAAIAPFTPVANTLYHMVWTIINGTTNALYVDGVALSLGTNTANPKDLSLAQDMLFANRATDVYDPDMLAFTQWNRALTAAEVLARFNGGLIAVDDQYGNQTNLWNVTDGNFTGVGNTGAWTAFGTNTITNPSGNALLITFDGGSNSDKGAFVQLDTSDDLDVNMTSGKKYAIRVQAKVTGGATGVKLEVINGSGVQSVALTASAKFYNLEIPFEGETWFFRLADMVTDNVVQLDAISLVQIGAVADFQPEGISDAQTTWFDRSTNSLDGTISGAETRIGPGNSILFAKFTEANARYWFLETNPDSLTFVGAYKIGQFDICKIFRPSTNPNITDLSETLNYGGIDTIAKYGGGTDLNERHGRRKVWSLAYTFFNETDRTGFTDLLEQSRKRPFYFSLNADEADPIVHAGRILGNPQIVPVAFEAYSIQFEIIQEPIQG